MNMKKITLPIKYWNDDNTRIISPEDDNGRKIEIGYFFGVQFTGHSIHYPQPLIYSHYNNNLILPTREMFMSLGRGTVYEDKMEYDANIENTELIQDGFVYYFVYNTANYFHFIYDTLPYLYGYFNEKKYFPNLKLLVSPPEGKNDLYPFVWDTFELLGITRDDVIFLDTKTRYNTVLVGSSLTHDGLSDAPPHKGIFNIINRMKGNHNNADKIYVSRRSWIHNNKDNLGTDYTERRRCVNEDDIVDFLQRRGFREIFCENLSMKDKIGIFNSAKIIVAPSGGGMANIIFSRPETKVISIDSPTFFDINCRLKYAMCHTKLHHFTDTEFVGRIEESIESEGSLSISGGLNSPWKVNLNNFKNFVDVIDDL